MARTGGLAGLNLGNGERGRPTGAEMVANQTNSVSGDGGAQSPVVLSGKYELLGEIGRGGMGVVLKARNPQLNKLVAIKVLNAVSLTDKSMRTRFELEAKAGANLSHPNLVPVIDCG